MSWKDYFYFQRGDKIAIIILLTLIIISGVIYIITKPSPERSDSESVSHLEKEFNEFQSQLTDKDTVDKYESRIAKNEDLNDSSHKYLYQEKLKQGKTIELNKADTSELKKIPGIGSAYANKIVKYRNLLGGYINIDQLKEIWGMDNILFDKIIPYITIEPEAIKIKINSATFQELNKHPYISYKQTKIIIDIRERKDKIESMSRLSLLDEFTDTDINRLSPYLAFD